MRIISITTGLLLLTLIFVSCENKKKMRNYKEIVPASDTFNKIPQKGEMGKSINLEWETPETWTEEKSTSRLRLATFSTGTNDDKAICTMISLTGNGGGLKPNILRWLDQLNKKMKSDNELKSFISKQKKFHTDGNFPAIFLDFSSLASSQNDISMYITIVTFPGSTLFIKMIGKKSILLKNRENFYSLCKSLKSGK